jgi:flagellar assembly protein FliH
MNPWAETVQLRAPLKDVFLAGVPSALLAMDPAVREAWQKAYDQGRIDGEKALHGELVKQRNELHELMNGTLASLRQAVPQVVRDTENMVVSLALEVARKLVSDMPITVPMVEAAVRDALTHVENSAKVTIRLHPADLELLQSANSPVLAPGEVSSDFRFLSSVDVTRGGCMVETRFGTVDARRETKFDLIKKNLPS